MNIIGPDSLVFGVDDVDTCARYLIDYGLEPAGDGVFVALDATSVVVRPRNDPSLPTALETGSMLRKTVYGVADQATRDAALHAGLRAFHVSHGRPDRIDAGWETIL